MVPPIRLWDAGVPNEAALKIMTRNSRMPDSLAADLDAECAACLMGARRLGELFDRYGRESIEECFDAIIDGTTQTFRREVLAKIPDGTYVWEDYAEHDGVDPPRLHAQRITLTKTPAKLVLDFTGTSPQAKGPINHCADYADGVFLAKWLAPILRNLADTPERMAQLDVNEGVVPLMEMRLPAEGDVADTGVSGPDQRPHVRDPPPARRAGRGAGQGGRRADAGRPGDDPLHRGLRQGRRRGAVPDARGTRRRLGRAVVRRRRGHHPRGTGLAQHPGRVRRGPLAVPGRAARTGSRLGRPRAAPRRPGVRQTHPHAARRPFHVDRRPVTAGLLGGARRPGRAAVPGDGRSGRAERADRRRLWPTPSRSGRARSSVSGPPVAAAGEIRSTARTTRSCGTWNGARSRSTGRGATTPSGSATRTCPLWSAPGGGPGDRPTSRSSIADLGTPCSPVERRTPRWISCERAR